MRKVVVILALIGLTFLLNPEDNGGGMVWENKTNSHFIILVYPRLNLEIVYSVKEDSGIKVSTSDFERLEEIMKKERKKTLVFWKMFKMPNR